MRPNRLTVLSIGLGAMLGATLAMTGPAMAQIATQWISGGGFAGKVAEPAFLYNHNDGPKLVVATQRDLFKLPDDYGEPFAVTSVNNKTVVWYRNPELGVRNVIIEGDRRLVQVIQRPSLKSVADPVEGAR